MEAVVLFFFIRLSKVSGIIIVLEYYLGTWSVRKAIDWRLSYNVKCNVMYISV